MSGRCCTDMAPSHPQHVFCFWGTVTAMSVHPWLTSDNRRLNPFWLCSFACRHTSPSVEYTLACLPDPGPSKSSVKIIQGNAHISWNFIYATNRLSVGYIHFELKDGLLAYCCGEMTWNEMKIYCLLRTSLALYLICKVSVSPTTEGQNSKNDWMAIIIRTWKVPPLQEHLTDLKKTFVHESM